MFRRIVKFDPWGPDQGSKNERDRNDERRNFGFDLQDFGSFFDFKGFSKGIFVLLALVLVGVWIGSGLYLVQPEEHALELVFGKYQETTTPGIHYNFPSPVGKVIKVKIATVNKEEIGKKRSSSGKESGEGVMLTGDENIVNINAEVLWKINDPKSFIFNIREDYHGYTVKNGTESALRDSIGKNAMSFILSGEGRAAVSQQAQETLQSILDGYFMGVTVISVQLKKVDPPERVIDAFRDVQSARSDKERMINEAESYRNDKIPRARGEAESILQVAATVKQQKIESALGEAARFGLLREQYNKSGGDLMMRRMYLETMEGILSSTDKLLISGDSDPQSYISLPELMKKKQ